MRMRACLIAAVLSVAPISLAMADPVAYGVAYDELYRIDLATRQATLVGNAGFYGSQPFGSLEGLTYGPGYTLYAFSDSLSQKPILTLSPTTGAATFLAPLNLGSGTGQFNSFDFGAAVTCDGQIWLSSATTRKLWRVSQTGGSTLVGVMDQTITGLAARGNDLYGASSRGVNALYKIDTSSAQTTLVGGFGTANSGWINTVSMNFDAAGTLWAAFNYVPPAPGGSNIVDWSNLATIDPATGTASVRGPIVGPESLRGIGLAGFAMGPAPCALPPINPPNGGATSAAPLPSISTWASLFLALLLSIVGWRSLSIAKLRKSIRI